LRIADDECRTTVPGLFAAGDAATRELVTGAASGGGAVNSAWALSSGRIAGEAAAREALTASGQTPARLNGLGTVAVAPAAEVRELPLRDFERTVEAAVHHYDIALWRTAPKLKAAKVRLDEIWCDLVANAHGEGRALVALRETAAMTATARWCTAAALVRDETRGIHVRIDRPETWTGPASRLLVGGLGTVWTRPETALLEAAA
jgi:succinate dehydrogenase/fumarate reductase flavoprotein subunit